MGEALTVQPSVMFEVQKILAVSAGAGNVRMYRVQWEPVWVSGLHLVGCENLIEEFIKQQESANQVQSPLSAGKDSLLHDMDSTGFENLSEPNKEYISQLPQNSSDSGLASSVEIGASQIRFSKSSKSEALVDICSADLSIRGNDISFDSSWESDNEKIHTPTFAETKIKVEDPVADSLSGLSLTQDECVPNTSTKSCYVQSNTDNTLGNQNNTYKPNQVIPDHRTMDILENEWCITEDNRYQCLKCSKIYKHKSHVTRHIQACHFDMRPYQCDYCSKSFSSKSGLKRHRVLHTGIKSHKCGVCEKTFSLKEALRMHFRVHTGEKPYQCAICGTGYSDKSNFRRHVLRCKEGKSVIISSTDIFSQGTA